MDPVRAGASQEVESSDAALEAELYRLLGLPPLAREEALQRHDRCAAAEADLLRRRLHYLSAVGLLEDEPRLSAWPPRADAATSACTSGAAAAGTSLPQRPEPPEREPLECLPRGARIGAYRLGALLDRGGGGVVFAATHEPTGREVALKLLRTPDGSGLGTGPAAGMQQSGAPVAPQDWRARFRREARAIARLVHPGICPLYDAGEIGGVPYLAMPRIRGTSLASCIARTRAREPGGHPTAGVDLDLALHLERPSGASAANGDERVRRATGRVGATRCKREDHARAASGRRRLESILLMVEKVAAAVHHAHERGLVHRDLKPANVLINSAGEPILIDFGLALDRDADEPRLTATTEIVGTPMYLAPEMVAGLAHEADPALDVHGLGVLLFECLTLEPPFAAPNREQVYRAILHRPPPDARHRNPFVPRDLVTVLRTAMAKDPAHRYGSVQAFAADLRCVRLGLPIASRPAPWIARAWRWSRRHRAAAALLGALSLTQAGVGVQTWRAHAAERTAEAQAELAQRHVAWTRLLASTAQVRARRGARQGAGAGVAAHGAAPARVAGRARRAASGAA